MSCTRPLQGWRGRTPTESGKYPVVFRRADGWPDLPMVVPCGQCIGCRLERSRQWALRCELEASLWEHNCFVTLTYNDEYLPSDYSLDKTHFQKFMKRLRKAHGTGIRVYYCGEYGDKSGRPHYHACLFNMDFQDRVLHAENNGQRYYRSDELQRLWSDPASGDPLGFCLVGNLTFESAAYTARYCTKKILSTSAFTRVVQRDGKFVPVTPEFGHSSLKPGIASEWFKKYQSDVYPHGYVVSRGVRMRPPKFFDRIYEIQNPKAFRRLVSERLQGARAQWLDDMTYRTDRNLVREKVKLAQVSHLKRGLDNDL